MLADGLPFILGICRCSRCGRFHRLPRELWAGCWGDNILATAAAGEHARDKDRLGFLSPACRGRSSKVIFFLSIFFLSSTPPPPPQHIKTDIIDCLLHVLVCKSNNACHFELIILSGKRTWEIMGNVLIKRAKDNPSTESGVYAQSMRTRQNNQSIVYENPSKQSKE